VRRHLARRAQDAHPDRDADGHRHPEDDAEHAQQAPAPAGRGRVGGDCLLDCGHARRAP
jgi:hypothetical protein